MSNPAIVPTGDLSRKRPFDDEDEDKQSEKRLRLTFDPDVQQEFKNIRKLIQTQAPSTTQERAVSLMSVQQKVSLLMKSRAGLGVFGDLG